jgi:YD repeat-containing protein
LRRFSREVGASIADGRMTQAVDSIAGTIMRTYDGFDRVTEEQTPQGEVTYAYDASGRRTSMMVAGQSAVNYTWDIVLKLILFRRRLHAVRQAAATGRTFGDYAGLD